MNTKKKFGKIVVVLMAVMVIAAGSMVTASANNHGDKPYKFTFLTTEGYQHTGFREKQDASSSYMKCIFSTHTYYGKVFASDGPDMVDVSHGNVYSFESGTTRFLKNWVYEEGYRSSTINGYQLILGQNRANGVWSPDSI